MSDMKTTQNETSVAEFLAGVENPKRAEAAQTVIEIMERVTGSEPKMWGPSIIGFGLYHYSRADGSEHTFPVTALSPRKANLTVYIMPGFKKYGDLLAKLGKHKHLVSCLYLTQLKNIDLAVLEELIAKSVADMRKAYKTEI